jgi:hypothetical protein
MQITHPFEVDWPPGDRVGILSFRVIATDQLNRRHTKRIKLQRLGERERSTVMSQSAAASARH